MKPAALRHRFGCSSLSLSLPLSLSLSLSLSPGGRTRVPWIVRSRSGTSTPGLWRGRHPDFSMDGHAVLDSHPRRAVKQMLGIAGTIGCPLLPDKGSEHQNPPLLSLSRQSEGCGWCCAGRRSKPRGGWRRTARSAPDTTTLPECRKPVHMCGMGCVMRGGAGRTWGTGLPA